MSGWEMVVGLEVHARLQTSTKAFCSCENRFGAEPNTLVCPVCLGLPGALPVLSGEVVRLAATMALATECKVHQSSIFSRKNYFYPDLPKGYQITQFDRPIATGGALTISVGGDRRTVGLTRIHIEEDAGKLIHDPQIAGDDSSLVDLNRAGVPLIEIVSEPDMRSSEEAVAYLTRLRQILMYTGVCDGNMEEGSLRADANVSVRREGEPLGTRAEVKNLNSFRFLARAIEFERERQIEILESGGVISQETRLFDPQAGETRSMRSKEEAHDYRYFPEPDLLPLELSASFISEVEASLPSLPGQRVSRYIDQLGLDLETAETIVAERSVADFFEKAVQVGTSDSKQIANWVRNDLLRVLNESSRTISELAITPEGLARLVGLIEKGTISGKIAKEIFAEMIESGGDPASIVDRKGLSQITDPEEIRAVARTILSENRSQAEAFRNGKSALMGFFIGQLMKKTSGRANPELAKSIFDEELGKN